MQYDRVSFATATTGTGTITAGAANSGFRTMAVAAIPDGSTVQYTIEDGTAWETGSGTVGAAGTTLTRTLSQSSTGALLVLSGSARCFLSPIAAHYNSLSPAGANLTLQYNSAGVLAGMSGTSWDDTNRSLTIAGATVTTSKPVLDLAQVWNNAATAFTAVKVNVTNTASASTSNLLDMQVGGVAKFTVDFTGALLSQGNITATPAASLQVLDSGSNVNANRGFLVTNFSGTALVNLASNWRFGWSSGVANTNMDTILQRGGVGIIEQRNGTNAQTLRVYATFTDVSNYERGVFDFTTNAGTLTLGTQKLGTGASRPIAVVVGGVTMLKLGVDGSVLATGTGGLGYGTGAGGAVTQLTSRTTGVTLNTPVGAITLVSAAGTTAIQSFTVTNSAVAATDIIRVCQKSGTDLYTVLSVTAVAAGSFRISFATSGGTTTEQPVFNFAVIKGAIS